MDFQVFVIGLIFVTLFFLDRYEKFYDSKEQFVVSRKGYTNPSTLLTPGWAPTQPSVNYDSKPKDFKNFGTFGSYPPNPICPSCSLGRDCRTPPYLLRNDMGGRSGDDLGTVCTQCSVIMGKNYIDLGKPFLVAGRSNGKPRVCRRLI